VALRAHRRLLTPLRGRLAEALAYPLRRGNRAAYVGIAALLGAVTASQNWLVTWLVLPLAVALFFAAVMVVIRTTANGQRLARGRELTDFWADIAAPLVRGDAIALEVTGGYHDRIVPGAVPRGPLPDVRVVLAAESGRGRCSSSDTRTPPV
jgi:hypothetical protein